ncbi:MAG TPA: hypothetical protein VM915_08525, partial [Verrucomicrobiae bacterium]|nr:hypothetical protein [Verrucomicrobiae bacterium]
MQNVGAALTTNVASGPLAGTIWAQAAASAAENAPYLRRVMERRPDLLEDADADWAARLLGEALAQAQAIALDPPPIED